MMNINYLDNIQSFLKNNKFIFIEANINTYNFPDNLHVDEIYHLACPASPRFYQKDPIAIVSDSGTANYQIIQYVEQN